MRSRTTTKAFLLIEWDHFLKQLNASRKQSVYKTTRRTSTTTGVSPLERLKTTSGQLKTTARQLLWTVVISKRTTIGHFAMTSKASFTKRKKTTLKRANFNQIMYQPYTILVRSAKR